MGRRVIQWGTGNTGSFALRYLVENPAYDLYLVENPAYDLVGVRCQTEEKDGQDAGVLAGTDPIGVRATRDTAALLASDADVVVFMPRTTHGDPSLPDSPDRAWYDELVAILRSGKNVVSPITAASHHRHLARGDDFVAGLDAAGLSGNSTVSFLGLDPGFFTDALPLALAGAVGAVRQIRTYEVLSYADYPKVETLRRLGIGSLPGDVHERVRGMLRPTWGGVPYLIGDAIGVEIDDIEIDVETEQAAEMFTSPGGMTVERGTVAGMNFRVRGLVDGAAAVIINHVTRMRDDVGTRWPVVGRHGGYRIEIDAYPPLAVDIPLGLPGGTGNGFDDALAMTAARCVNAIDAVIAAPLATGAFSVCGRSWASTRCPDQPDSEECEHA